MYNRYISTDHGAYSPIPEESGFSSHQETLYSTETAVKEKHASKHSFHTSEGLKDLWNSLAGRLHLDSDALLLLALLYFLYREDADEELLIALGLLLFL